MRRTDCNGCDPDLMHHLDACPLAGELRGRLWLRDWWELPPGTPMEEVSRAFVRTMVRDVEEGIELRQLCERREREATYPHPYTVHPITGVKS